jgi:hypothetical protein
MKGTYHIKQYLNVVILRKIFKNRFCEYFKNCFSKKKHDSKNTHRTAREANFKLS